MKKSQFTCRDLGRSTVQALYVVVFLIPNANSAEWDLMRDCGEPGTEAFENVKHAFGYLLDHRSDLKSFEFDARLPRQQERVRRRIDKYMGGFWINCKPRDYHECDEVDGWTHSGKWQKSGVSPWKGFTLNICYETIKDQSNQFCELVEIIAHESGHALGMPARIGHDDSGNEDMVYQFGWFAGDMCDEDQLKRDLEGNTTPPDPDRPVPTEGIVLYQKKNFELAGRGRNVTGSQIYDLRRIGWNDAISSVELKDNQAWLLCKHSEVKGWCTILTSTEPDMTSRELNNSSSSLIQYGTVDDGPQRGVTVYKDDSFNDKRVHWIRTDADNLKDKKIGDSITGIQVHDGEWEFCKHKDCDGNCITLSAGESVEHLKSEKMNDSISCIQRVDTAHPRVHTVPRFSPFIIGASIGLARVDSAEIVTLDSQELTWSITAGYEFNDIFTLEGGYIHLGDHREIDNEISLSGVRLFAVGSYRVNDYLRFFGKLGAADLDADITTTQQQASDSELGLAVGIGGSYQVSFRTSIRADVEMYDVDMVDYPWAFSVGVDWRFGD